MPPFSRGAGRILFQLRTRASSSISRRPLPLSKPAHNASPSTRPTRVERPSAALKPPESLLPQRPISWIERLNPLYHFALLRLSIAQISKSFLYRLRNQYRRLPGPFRRTISFVYHLGVLLALVVPPGIILRNHFYDIIRVTGPSMSPYLNPDFEDGATGARDISKSTDKILLKLYRPHEDLRRGMVVAFRKPHDPEEWAIKRIVAMEGDRVFPLPHYPGVERLDGRGLIVPFGHIWVEGDVCDSNKKGMSMDSNIYGPVSVGLVVGKATHVIPSLFSRWRTLSFAHFKLPERVQPNAVILQDPDQEHRSQEVEEMFHNGKAAEFLQFLRIKSQEEGVMEKYRQNPDLVNMFHVVRTEAQRQLSRRDSATTKLAMSLLETVDEILGEE